MAEKGGFEPPIQVSPYNHLAGDRLKPLGHFSIKINFSLDKKNGGEGGIRTHGTRKSSTVFKTASFNHSDTSPNDFT